MCVCGGRRPNVRASKGPEWGGWRRWAILQQDKSAAKCDRRKIWIYREIARHIERNRVTASYREIEIESLRDDRLLCGEL